MCGLIIFTSCQKELSYEAGLGKGSLKKDASGECLPVNINGSYKTDTLLKALVNYVDIQVNVSDVGSYSMKTDSVNGYSFSAAGVFAAQGLNTVRLIGSGKPIAAGTNMFTLKFDTSVCQFSVTVTGAGGGGGGGGTQAAFTLVGSPSTCTGAMQTNNYYATVQTSTSNYVDIKANVTTAGTYTITVPSVNGVSFSSTGSLTVGTTQTIRLLASGTPTAAGSIQYALNTSSPASNCGFSLIVQAAPIPAAFTFECPSNPTFFGIYQAGQSTVGDSVKINITSIAGGSYSITTSTTTNSNGVIFSGSGVLPPSPNPQSVTLYSSGTPTAAGPFTYTITGQSVTSTCTFNQTYSSAPVPTGDSITANINGVHYTFNDTPTALSITNMGVTLLTINGFGTSSSTNDEISVFVSANGPITPGSYNVNTIPFPTAGGTYTDPSGNNTYITSFTATAQTNPLTIVIQTISATRVKGTFSGRFYDNNGSGPGFVTATNGTFDVPIQ